MGHPPPMLGYCFGRGSGRSMCGAWRVLGVPAKLKVAFPVFLSAGGSIRRWYANEFAAQHRPQEPELAPAAPHVDVRRFHRPQREDLQL